MAALVADVWAATGRRQPAEHLQSYLLAFRGGVLARPPLRDFFARVGPARSNRDVVLTYELGLTRTIDAAGLTRDLGWTHEEIGLPARTDLMLGAWRQLLEAGMPFVKRVLLTGPQFVDQRGGGRAGGAAGPDPRLIRPVAEARPALH